MATIEKRVTGDGTTYRAKVRLKGFPPESATFERLTDARQWATQTEADMRAGRYFGASKRHTFKDLADEYEQHAAELRSFEDRKSHLKRWRELYKRNNNENQTFKIDFCYSDFINRDNIRNISKAN